MLEELNQCNDWIVFVSAFRKDLKVNPKTNHWSLITVKWDKHMRQTVVRHFCTANKTMIVISVGLWLWHKSDMPPYHITTETLSQGCNLPPGIPTAHPGLCFCHFNTSMLNILRLIIEPPLPSHRKLLFWKDYSYLSIFNIVPEALSQFTS